MNNRREFLHSLSSLALVAIRPASGFGAVKSDVERAQQFLVSLFDPALNLLPEFRGSKTYWLYHDNYLAAKVLKTFVPEISMQIQNSIRKLGITESGKIEIVFGESRHPLPFRHYRLVNVKRITDKLIKTEVVGDRPHTDWQRYCDLLFLAAIAESKPTYYGAAMKMWDGRGFRDAVNEKRSLYATYKLALALIAAARLRLPVHEKVLRQLTAMQRADGGFITDYDANGKPVGEANVETTSLAILALSK